MNSGIQKFITFLQFGTLDSRYLKLILTKCVLFLGKSSLTLALFRIIESAGGSISIDGQVNYFLLHPKYTWMLTLESQCMGAWMGGALDNKLIGVHSLCEQS